MKHMAGIAGQRAATLLAVDDSPDDPALPGYLQQAECRMLTDAFDAPISPRAYLA